MARSEAVEGTCERTDGGRRYSGRGRAASLVGGPHCSEGEESNNAPVAVAMLLLVITRSKSQRPSNAVPSEPTRNVQMPSSSLVGKRKAEATSVDVRWAIDLRWYSAYGQYGRTTR